MDDFSIRGKCLPRGSNGSGSDYRFGFNSNSRIEQYDNVPTIPTDRYKGNYEKFGDRTPKPVSPGNAAATQKEKDIQELLRLLAAVAGLSILSCDKEGEKCGLNPLTECCSGLECQKNGLLKIRGRCVKAGGLRDRIFAGASEKAKDVFKLLKLVN
ncbi:hypothetical protein Ciccas_011403 [Cichlidogyrus casuarinus]|uniref:Uncharacterized protein n=1 Tax=Cichlidogyrus casuarinus TaxID=1844966 RepID=A0ABD2PSL0_9PLAT